MTNNEFLSFYMEYYNSAKTKGIGIEATNICPIECPACPRQDPRRKPQINKTKEITIPQYEKLLLFFDKIRFCGQISDPIYHKNFHELLKYSKKYPQKSFSVHTNGTRKKLDWWKTSFNLSGANVRWVFGLDGADQEIANIYRVNTRFDEVFDMMKLGVSMGVNIIWQFIIFRHNEHQIEQATSMAKQHKITLELITTDRWFDNLDLMRESGIQPPLSPQWNSLDNNNYIRKYFNFQSNFFFINTNLFQ
jgi:MoaA/NifB/PqqE/SkfB family radical SAM enzyme